MSDQLKAIFDRIVAGNQTEADLAALRDILVFQGNQDVVQSGNGNINIGQGRDIYIYQGTDAETIKKILKEIVPELGTGNHPSGIPHNLPRSGVVKFVGRDEVLATLHQQLQQNQPVAISAVAGMGGIGKTELALQYAQYHWQQGSYPGGICWLRAQEAEVEAQIISYARSQLSLQLPEELKTLEEQLAYCWQHWREGKVLVVLDDVRDYGLIKSSLPPSEPKFKVLITTREKLGAPVVRLDLDVLKPLAAMALLQSLVGRERLRQEPLVARKLCKWLGYLPLGLELVGRYLAEEEDLSLAEMLSRLQDEGVQNLALRRNPNAPWTSTAERGVAAAFELSWERLEETAQQLGCLLSLFALAPIPWNLVEEVIKVCNSQKPSASLFQRLMRYLPFFNKNNHQPPSSLSQLETTAILEEARATLRRLHLIQRSDKNTYQLHPLIREFFRDKGEESAEVEEMKQGLAAVMVAVAKEIPQSITLELVEKFQPAIPHLQEVARELLEYVSDEDLITPCTRLGRFYDGQGLYKLAEPWFEECKAVAETRLGNKHPDFATSLNNLAELYKSQVKYSEAEPLYKDAITINQQSLPPNHPSLANHLNNLAGLYEFQGRYSEAEPLYKDAIAIDKQSLPPNHPSLAIDFNNLAGLYESQGRYSEAEPLYKDAIAIDKQSLPPNHPSLANHLNNLAESYYSQGRYSEAEPLYIEAIAIDKQSLPPNHPFLARDFNNLAGLYYSQGRYLKAESLYKDAIAIVKQSLPPNHPDLATHLNNLALLYYSQGRYSEAESLYKDAIAIVKQSLPLNHPDLATHLTNLAGLYHSQGYYSEAEPLYLKALRICDCSLGSEHPNTVIVWENFVDFLRQVVSEGQESVLSEHPMVQEELAKIKEFRI